MEHSVDTPLRDTLDYERVNRLQGNHLFQIRDSSFCDTQIGEGKVKVADYLQGSRTLFHTQSYIAGIPSAQMVAGLLEMGVMDFTEPFSCVMDKLDNSLLPLLYALNALNFDKGELFASERSFYRDPFVSHKDVVTLNSCSGHLKYQYTSDGRIKVGSNFDHFGLILCEAQPPLIEELTNTLVPIIGEDIDPIVSEIESWNSKVERRNKCAILSSFLDECRQRGLNVRKRMSRGKFVIDVQPYSLEIPFCNEVNNKEELGEVVEPYFRTFEKYWGAIISSVNAIAAHQRREDLMIDSALLEVIKKMEGVEMRGVLPHQEHHHSHGEGHGEYADHPEGSTGDAHH